MSIDKIVKKILCSCYCYTNVVIKKVFLIHKGRGICMKRYMLLSILVLGVNVYAEGEEQSVAVSPAAEDTVSVVEQVEIAVELATTVDQDSETKTEVVTTPKCPCGTRPRPRPRRVARRVRRSQQPQQTQKA